MGYREKGRLEGEVLLLLTGEVIDLIAMAKFTFCCLLTQSVLGLVCLFACIDRFKSRVTTFHKNCWDANVCRDTGTSAPACALSV